MTSSPTWQRRERAWWHRTHSRIFDYYWFRALDLLSGYPGFKSFLSTSISPRSSLIVYLCHLNRACKDIWSDGWWFVCGLCCHVFLFQETLLHIFSNSSMLALIRVSFIWPWTVQKWEKLDRSFLWNKWVNFQCICLNLLFISISNPLLHLPVCHFN